jgi:undecaprenyl-diphosphatase
MSAVASLKQVGRSFKGIDHRVLRRPAHRVLRLNALPHPHWLDALPNTAVLLTRGGAIWALGVLGACLLGLPRSGRALRELLPSLVGATLIVEYPLKALFRRRRPFSATLRAVALGGKPGAGMSFPSGDAASSFAGAWVLSTVWPRLAPIFLGLASGLSLNRVYVGVHRPSDVASGALCGVLLAELIRRVTRRFLGLTPGKARPAGRAQEPHLSGGRRPAEG